MTPNCAKIQVEGSERLNRCTLSVGNSCLCQAVDSRKRNGSQDGEIIAKPETVPVAREIDRLKIVWSVNGCCRLRTNQLTTWESAIIASSPRV